MKLNSKGFTLVELIATIAIITLLTIIVAPSVISSLNSGKNKSYEILVANIVTASQELYEEIYSNDLLGVSDKSELFHYNSSGTLETPKRKIVINNNSITVNLQTLVNNGFLSGTNKDGKKIITNPKEDNTNIGDCEIKIIRKSTTAGKVTYVVEAADGSATYCPKTEDYKKGVK